MADNTTLPGTGEVYASDDINGVKYQRCKLSIGPANQEPVDASSDNPLPVIAGGDSKDPLTNAMNVIPYEHHEIHGGSMFHADYAILSMGSADYMAIGFTTMAGPKRAHLVLHWAAKVSSSIALIEGVTFVGGTAYTPRNRKRVSGSGVSALTNFKTFDSQSAQTVTGGTTLTSETVFAVKQSTPGISRGEAEWVLEASTNYAIVLTALENSGAGWIGLDWYEHTDSN